MEIDNKAKYSCNKTKIIAITNANKIFKNQVDENYAFGPKDIGPEFKKI